MVRLKINGRDITVDAGSTVLEAAQAEGIRIPNLCASKGLTPYGGCRLCLVEIKGKKGYLPACSTEVEEGLEVKTDTPRLQSVRRQTLELILSEHPHACLICTEKKDCDEYKSTIRKVGEVTGCVLCTENGRCELQDVVTELKVERIPWPASYRDFEVRREDPFFDRNYNLCILCARCVRVCREVRGAAAISVVFRGPRAVVGTSLDRPLIDSGCQFCGACVDVCPTGSLAERALKGEGLPDESRETVCPFCSLGCALNADLKNGRIIGSRPREDGPVNRGQACVKGRFVVRDAVHTSKRFLRPMVRRYGELVETGWDEALDSVVKRLKMETDREPALVVSSQLALEDQYIAQKFGRAILGTEPLVDFPRLSGLSLFRAELRKQNISLPVNFDSSSLSTARTIMLVGADIAQSHPVLWLEVLKAVRQDARLLVWNSPASAPGRWATLSLWTVPGNELTVLVHLCRLLLEQRPADNGSAFPGMEEFKTSLEKAGQDTVSSSAGLEKEELQSAVRLLKDDGPAYFLIGPGLAQGPDAPRLIQMFWNLALLSEARLIPLAAENNERGAVELWPSESSNGAFGSQVFDGLEKGHFRTLYLAGNLPGLGRMKTPEFLIVQGCYQSAAVELAEVLLPAATWAEADGTFINAEGRIQRFLRLVDPLGEAKPDWWIFCRLAEKLGNKNFSFQSPAEISEEMSQAIPSLQEASTHHLKRGRPAFVVEDKDSKPSARFIPLASRDREKEYDDGLVETPPMADVPDYYRGLDLREEVKGLKRLRGRDRLPDQKQEK